MNGLVALYKNYQHFAPVYVASRSRPDDARQISPLQAEEHLSEDNQASYWTAIQPRRSTAA